MKYITETMRHYYFQMNRASHFNKQPHKSDNIITQDVIIGTKF